MKYIIKVGENEYFNWVRNTNKPSWASRFDTDVLDELARIHYGIPKEYEWIAVEY